MNYFNLCSDCLDANLSTGNYLFNKTKRMHYFLILFFDISSLLAGYLGCLTRVRLQQLQEQHHSFLPGCAMFFMCPNNGHAASVWDFSVRTDGGHNACNCTQGLYDSCERVCTESWLSEEKSLAEPGNRTCVSTGPGVLVQRSTSRAILPLSYRITQRDKSINTNRWLVNAKTLASNKLSTAKVTLTGWYSTCGRTVNQPEFTTFFSLYFYEAQQMIVCNGTVLKAPHSPITSICILMAMFISRAKTVKRVIR